MSYKVGAKLFLKKEGKKRERKGKGKERALVYWLTFVVFICFLPLCYIATLSLVARVEEEGLRDTRIDKMYGWLHLCITIQQY
jgi:hypothetical protein